ncbi:hypothetical protein SGRA_2265 [Saprospira grandis str. Lewin]|uniref:Uncharacterized protein n=1 Tax=Saprospira grandis (strain Lewin) TaxID=984262 RepID=H6L3P6_SAPGL|nr:hypothetical protein SGRA_2265 [Saprospira grandis str. Lewin]
MLNNILIVFWGLRSKAAALRYRARYSLGPSALRASVWPNGHPFASLGHTKAACGRPARAKALKHLLFQ